MLFYKVTNELTDNVYKTEKKLDRINDEYFTDVKNISHFFHTGMYVRQVILDCYCYCHFKQPFHCYCNSYCKDDNLVIINYTLSKKWKTKVWKANSFILGKSWSIKDFEQEFKDYLDYNFLFCKAVVNGETERVEYILKEFNIDPSFNDDYAIIQSCINNHPEIVEILLKDNRVNPSMCCDWPIREAAWKGYTNIVELLLKKFNNTDNIDLTIRNGHIEIIDILIDKYIKL